MHARPLRAVLAAVLPVILAAQASCRSASQPSATASGPNSLVTTPGASTSTATATATPIPTATATPTARAEKTRPQTRQACDACRGDWDRHGIAEVEGCICRTKDAGKTCRDGADCEGQCLVADDAHFEVAGAGPPPRGHYVGKCSEFETTFGCFRMLDRGARAKGPLPAEEAARHICVD